MNKLDYLDGLQRAMGGLPPETVAKTLAYYEQRFVDGVAAGRTEEEVAGELDDPKKIAMTLRTSAHMSAFEQKKNPANLLRLVFSAIGLAIFNLFMVVPAMVYSALLAALYACALGFYIAGVAVTGSGLAGANELVIDGPLHRFVMNDDEADDNVQTKVSISEQGVQVFQEPVDRASSDKPAADADGDKDEGASKVIRRAESVAGHGLKVSTSMDAGSRTTQSFFGIGMVLAGIFLFLLSLVVTKYTFIGLKRYVEMNFALLRGH